jgi:hypothetical protein
LSPRSECNVPAQAAEGLRALERRLTELLA